MPLDKDQIKATYPLPVYNYQVTIESTTLGFSEVSGLSVEFEPVSYKHGLSFAMGSKLIPGMRKPIRLTLKKGIVAGNSFLTTWFQDAYANPFKSAKKDVQIDLCDESGKPVVRWKVQGALPIRLDAPSFDAASNAVAIESMELAAHNILVDFSPA